MTDLRRDDRPKIQIVFEPVVVPEDPPDRECVLCLQMRDGWRFHQDAKSESPICFDCTPPISTRLYTTFGYGRDAEHMRRAHSALHALKDLANAG